MKYLLEKEIAYNNKSKSLYKYNYSDFNVEQVEGGWIVKFSSDFNEFSIRLKTGDIKIYKTLTTVAKTLALLGVKEFNVSLK